jgi:hypothetical protein
LICEKGLAENRSPMKNALHFSFHARKLSCPTASGLAEKVISLILKFYCEITKNSIYLLKNSTKMPKKGRLPFD